MESLFHFIFELFKIAILGSFYAILTIILIKIIAHFSQNNALKSIAKYNVSLFFINGFCISIGLFYVMQTHYGNHGLGDVSRLPLSYNRTILEVDGIIYLEKDYKGEGLEILDDFLIENDNIWEISYKNDYFIYNIEKNTSKTYTLLEFEAILKEKGLSRAKSFHNFDYYYNKYWNGWRFFLLP